MEMLYTLSSMFKLRICLLFIFSHSLLSNNIIEFENLESNNDASVDNLIDHDGFLYAYENWISQKPVKDVWQKEIEYKTVLNAWERKKPAKISKLSKYKLEIVVNCDEWIEIEGYGGPPVCYDVENEELLGFNVSGSKTKIETRIEISRDFLRENFQNIGLYYIRKASVYIGKNYEVKWFLGDIYYVLLNKDDVIKIGVVHDIQNKIHSEEYTPLNKVAPTYPRRAQERGVMGYALVEFTVTDTGSVEDAVAIEGYCSYRDPYDPGTELRTCSMFNSASVRAALKLKYKPLIFNGQAVPVHGVRHRLSYILDN